MNPEFYAQRYAEVGYAKGQYRVDLLLRSAAFRRWASRHPQVAVCDLGCGRGVFLSQLLKSLHGQTIRRSVGLDLVQQEGLPFEFMRCDLSQETLPFADGELDLVTCNHVLEHIFTTERFLREIHRVLHPEGLAVVSVPNVASWISRLLFLIGCQPLGSELGTETVTYGFRPRWLQGKLAQFIPSGHIRDFTPAGLKDLLQRCGFQPVGWWAQEGGIAWLSRNMGIIATRTNHG